MSKICGKKNFRFLLMHCYILLVIVVSRSCVATVNMMINTTQHIESDFDRIKKVANSKILKVSTFR